MVNKERLLKRRVILGKIWLCLVGPDVICRDKIEIRILIRIRKVDALRKLAQIDQKLNSVVNQSKPLRLGSL